MSSFLNGPLRCPVNLVSRKSPGSYATHTALETDGMRNTRYGFNEIVHVFMLKFTESGRVKLYVSASVPLLSEVLMYRVFKKFVSSR